jgi:hypothetical protein
MLAGCREANQRALGDTLDEYHHALRWNDGAGVAEHLGPEQRRRRAKLGHLLQGVRIVGIEVGSMRMEGEKRARVRVRVDWYRESTLRLNTTVLEQLWELHQHGRWVMAEQRSRSGPVFPLTIGAKQPSGGRAGADDVDGARTTASP